jgi:hypothetical protein
MEIIMSKDTKKKMKVESSIRSRARKQVRELIEAGKEVPKAKFNALFKGYKIPDVMMSAKDAIKVSLDLTPKRFKYSSDEERRKARNESSRKSRKKAKTQKEVIKAK